ncbi:YciI family protein [Algoriphagus sp. D3-2-R+10]|uniref:YciI family protein n=1 Tax=Algoriphagus aurantiacus TaxID=3103948 RepID=UPI002B3FF701|nr:YciI family protein [Algoriphagus sp. D3-2-R+10]MEB2776439.1 YciI family protein [Algoriphagus sp. D3-2-R+10]
MKKLFFLLILTLSAPSYSFAQNETYDETMAKEVGADDYGMRKYVIAFLYRGERVSEYTDQQRSDIQAGHMANINQLVEEGQLVMAGPFFGNEELRGLFIFAVESLEEAEKLTATDPAVKAGVLRMELKEWYGSAALMLMADMHSKIAKINI